MRILRFLWNFINRHKYAASFGVSVGVIGAFIGAFVMIPDKTYSWSSPAALTIQDTAKAAPEPRSTSTTTNAPETVPVPPTESENADQAVTQPVVKPQTVIQPVQSNPTSQVISSPTPICDMTDAEAAESPLEKQISNNIATIERITQWGSYQGTVAANTAALEQENSSLQKQIQAISLQYNC